MLTKPRVQKSPDDLGVGEGRRQELTTILKHGLATAVLQQQQKFRETSRLDYEFQLFTKLYYLLESSIQFAPYFILCIQELP